MLGRIKKYYTLQEKEAGIIQSINIASSSSSVIQVYEKNAEIRGTSMRSSFVLRCC